jgi:hypothetical protein
VEKGKALVAKHAVKQTHSPIPCSFNFWTFNLISSLKLWATTEALTLTPLVGSLTMEAFRSELELTILVELMLQTVVVLLLLLYGMILLLGCFWRCWFVISQKRAIVVATGVQ